MLAFNITNLINASCTCNFEVQSIAISKAITVRGIQTVNALAPENLCLTPLLVVAMVP